MNYFSLGSAALGAGLMLIKIFLEYLLSYLVFLHLFDGRFIRSSTMLFHSAVQDIFLESSQRTGVGKSCISIKTMERKRMNCFQSFV